MQERFHTFTVLVSTINRYIHKIKTEEMAEFQLKSSHVSCLYYIYREEKLTAKELCDLCGEDKANISRTIKYLETNGYLRCKTLSPKRYQGELLLTEKGIEVGKYITEKVDNVLKKASEGLSKEDRLVMYKSLALIHDNLDKICKNYKGENND